MEFLNSTTHLPIVEASDHPLAVELAEYEQHSVLAATVALLPVLFLGSMSCSPLRGAYSEDYLKTPHFPVGLSKLFFSEVLDQI